MLWLSGLKVNGNQNMVLLGDNKHLAADYQVLTIELCLRTQVLRNISCLLLKLGIVAA